jgi:hypothetical protein
VAVDAAAGAGAAAGAAGAAVLAVAAVAAAAAGSGAVAASAKSTPPLKSHNKNPGHVLRDRGHFASCVTPNWRTTVNAPPNLGGSQSNCGSRLTGTQSPHFCGH